MKGKLISSRTGELVEEWSGTVDELRERFNYEGQGYHLQIYTDDGEPFIELHLD